MDVEELPPPTVEQIELIGAADIVVGILSCSSPDDVTAAAEAAREAAQAALPGSRTVLVHTDAVPMNGAAPPKPAAEDAVRLLACPLAGVDRFAVSPPKLGDSYRTLFGISQALRARACAVFASEAEGITPGVMQLLVRGVLDGGADVVFPYYARRKFEGLINAGIGYPLVRALYGKRIHSPISADLGFSPAFMAKSIGETQAGVRDAGATWAISKAVRENLELGEARLGPKPPAPRDPADLSTVLSEVLSSLFLDMERSAAYWQRIRGSRPVPAVGAPRVVSEDTGAAQVTNMIDAFQLGYRNLLDVWGLILPPASLVELKRLTRAPLERFRVMDELWARIVYDLGLAYRLRIMNRDHLLRAITPLYLAWVASYALEVQDANAAAVEERIERLCGAYEAQKPYLLSRWRWPDRFNP